MENLPADHFVKSQQFVATTHRDVYPAIEPTQATLSQTGKVAIITGASQGLGARAFVPAFAAAGAKAIVLVARSADKLKEVADLVALHHPNVETLAVPTYISNPSSVATLFDVDQVAWWDEMILNIRSTFLMTQSFLQSFPTPSTPARIISFTTGAAYEVFPALSAYGISKLAVLQLMTYVAVENPNVFAVALHPGIVLTDTVIDSFKPFALDTPELVGGAGVWLVGWQGQDRSFLSGRFVTVNWDVEDLVQRKDEILKGELLNMDINAKLGAAHFVQ